MEISVGKLVEAYRLYTTAYRASKRLWGDDHPETKDNAWREKGLREMLVEGGVSLDKLQL